MNIRLRTEKSISEQAAEWSGRLETGCAREHAAFAAWLRESPHHVREYLLTTALEKELDAVDLQDLKIEKILADANQNIVPLAATDQVGWAESSKPNRRSTNKNVGLRRLSPTYRGLGIAAVLAIVAVSIWQWPGSQAYATAVGEQRTFELPDGSLVELSPSSRMKVKISSNARDVELLAGEALFKVKHETTRPFRVRSGATLIEDLGTQFHVYRRSSGTVVSVIEGAVQIASVRIDAGEEARVATDGKTLKRSALDSAQINSWRQRHLTFSGDTLADIATDFNRYNRAPHIRIEGETLRAKRYSGAFDADDPESLVEYLRQSDGVEVKRNGDELIIRPRQLQ